MRSRSLKEETNEGMEIDKLGGTKLKAEPQLSGAYIRGLVKQLTSSRTKETMNPKGQNTTKLGENLGKHPEIDQPQQPKPHKKQVRRRLHTSRPYQERLLNMAEARREIVTALKFHRAAMKQANEQKQQQEQGQQQLVSPLQIPDPQPCFESEDKMIKSRRNPRIYPSNKENHSYYLDNLNYPSFSCPPPPPPPPRPPPPPPLPELAYPFPWQTTTPIFPAITDDTLNFPLPNQTLGLNLNFHGFTNLDTTLFQNNTNPSPVFYSASSPSSSSSPPLSIATEELPSVAKEVLPPPTVPEPYGGLQQVMDDHEMAEIGSLGEQHEMEWNDSMNLAASAWCLKFLNGAEINPDEVKDEDSRIHPYDEFLELPASLNSSDACDFSSKELLNDLDLPCMDIGDIDGMDGDWLA